MKSLNVAFTTESENDRRAVMGWPKKGRQIIREICSSKDKQGMKKRSKRINSTGKQWGSAKHEKRINITTEWSHDDKRRYLFKKEFTANPMSPDIQRWDA